jgi:hypothetical protein
MLRALVIAVLAGALFAGIASVVRAENASTLFGDWELVGNCRGERVKLTLKLFDSPGNRWGGTVYYWQWDGDQRGRIIADWNVEGTLDPSGASITLMPKYYALDEILLRKYGPNYFKRYPVRFDLVGGMWRGKIADPTCDEVAFFDRPGPPKTVASSGRALSAAAWLGKSPMSLIGGQTLFDYSGLGSVPKDTGVAADTVWTNAVVEKVVQNALILNVTLESVVTSACQPRHCGDREGARIYSIFPSDSLHFAQSVRPGVTEVCRFSVKWRSWSCHKTSRALPSRSGGSLAQWLWNNLQRLDAAGGSGWRTERACRRVVEPCPLPDCPSRMVCDEYRVRDVEGCRRKCVAALPDDVAAREECTANCSK